MTRFTAPDGHEVRVISRDGVQYYTVMAGRYWVADVRTISDLARYVDLASLEEVTQCPGERRAAAG